MGLGVFKVFIYLQQHCGCEVIWWTERGNITGKVGKGSMGRKVCWIFILKITSYKYSLIFFWCYVYYYSDEDELKVKEETGATIRCFPFEQPQGPNKCLMTGNPADEVAIFAKSYWSITCYYYSRKGLLFISTIKNPNWILNMYHNLSIDFLCM